MSAVISIDVGNSRIKLAVCRADDAAPLPDIVSLTTAARLDTIDWEQLADFSHREDCDGAILSGSDTVSIPKLRDQWPTSLPPLQTISSHRQLKLGIDVEEPGGVGLDRLLNSIGANLIRKGTHAAIVIDMGTATTVDFTDSCGTFRGGAILPGLELGAKALNDYTTALPLVDVRGLAEKDVQGCGRSTTQAIEAGLLYGHLGAIRALVDEMELDREKRFTNTTKLPGHLKLSPQVILTGGLADCVPEHYLGAIRIDHLALRAQATLFGKLEKMG